jgi:hypothetical protein
MNVNLLLLSFINTDFGSGILLTFILPTDAEKYFSF